MGSHPLYRGALSPCGGNRREDSTARPLGCSCPRWSGAGPSSHSEPRGLRWPWLSPGAVAAGKAPWHDACPRAPAKSPTGEASRSSEREVWPRYLPGSTI